MNENVDPGSQLPGSGAPEEETGDSVGAMDTEIENAEIGVAREQPPPVEQQQQ